MPVAHTSPGVGYLVPLMVTHLRDMDRLLDITGRHIECVELAGLCHDLGHCPWSHVWDGIFPAALYVHPYVPYACARPNKKWNCARAREIMFGDMVGAYQLDITPEEATLVKALIAGDREHCPYVLTLPLVVPDREC